jgi:predicted nucleic acid-binding protein
MELVAGNKYLFDTTVFIDALWKRPIAKKLYYQARFYPVSVGFSVITEAELWYGINEFKFRTVQEHINLLKPFRRYFVNVTIARRAGELQRLLVQSGIKRDDCPSLDDCIIAATGEYYDLTICTKNRTDFGLFRRFSISVLEYS